MRLRLRLRWFYARSRITRRRWVKEAARDAGVFGDQENAETTPPEDEHVTWAALWMVELYLPDNAEDLVEGLRELGWDRDEGLAIRDAVKWVRTARATGQLGWTRLGPFRPQAARDFPMMARADIPEPFASLQAKLLQLGPGVTALVASFVLSESEQACLDRTLRERTEARAEAHGRTGVRTFPPRMVKEGQIAAERGRIRSAAAGWIAQHIPGCFAVTGANLPSWDLITTELSPLIRSRDQAPDWRDALGVDYGERWSFEPPDDDLVLVLPPFRVIPEPRPTFTGRRQILIDALGEGRPKQFYSVVNRIDEQVAPTLAAWGAVYAVDSYNEGLAGPRDKRLPTKATYRATRSQLGDLMSRILPAVRDLAGLEALGSYLDETRSRLWYRANAADLHLLDSPNQRSLLDWLRERLARESTAVRRHADEVAAVVRAYTDTLVAGSNLRLQRAVVGLSIVLLVLTGAGIWISIHGSRSSTQSVRPAPSAVRKR